MRTARCEHHMLQNILSHSNLEIRYSTGPVSVEIDTSSPHQSNAYPVSVNLARVKHQNGTNGTGTANVSDTVPNSLYLTANIASDREAMDTPMEIAMLKSTFAQNT